MRLILMSAMYCMPHEYTVTDVFPNKGHAVMRKAFLCHGVIMEHQNASSIVTCLPDFDQCKTVDVNNDFSKTQLTIEILTIIWRNV